MATTYLVAGLLTPFFGAAIDWFGYRAILVLASAIAITGVHLLLALTMLDPTISLVLLGFCYSIYASALWPSIAVVIEPKYQATAYGVVTAVQNFGLAVSPLVVSQFMPPQDCSTYKDCVTAWNHTEARWRRSVLEHWIFVNGTLLVLPPYVFSSSSSAWVCSASSRASS